ncbi:MAG: SBBP repeat-containing protein, partial [Chloroflexota bacterium]
GVDLEVTGEGSRLAQRLVARPGADLAAVSLRLEGADSLALAADGLRVSTAVGQYRLPLLEVVGADGRAIQPRTSAPRVAGNVVAAPFTDPRAGEPAVTTSIFAASVTPDLIYAGLLDGSSTDLGYAIDVNEAGSAYVTGETLSSDFPTSPGAFDTAPNGHWEAFVAKVNPAGSALLYSTFLGGSANDTGSAIVVDEAGNAYVTGTTASSNFPVTSGVFDPSFNGGNDIFVAKLNSAGTGLLYATFLGGSSVEGGYGIALDGEGNAYITGTTESDDFPASLGAFDTIFNNGGRMADGFVAKLDFTGSTLVYATYLGGDSEDYGRKIAVDAAGSAFVTGDTTSADFPTTPGAFDATYNPGSAAFVIKLNAAGSDLVYSTFLGGDVGYYYGDKGQGIAVDGEGNAYVAGVTDNSNFPVTPGAFDRTYSGGNDAFVVKLDPAGSDLIYATLLGGSGNDGVADMDVDEEGSAYIAGYTTSIDFPTTLGAFGTRLEGSEDAFVAKINPLGNSLLYATLFGVGGDFDIAYDIAVDRDGKAYISGGTRYGSSSNIAAYVAKLNPDIFVVCLPLLFLN